MAGPRGGAGLRPMASSAPTTRSTTRARQLTSPPPDTETERETSPLRPLGMRTARQNVWSPRANSIRSSESLSVRVIPLILSISYLAALSFAIPDSRNSSLPTPPPSMCSALQAKINNSYHSLTRPTPSHIQNPKTLNLQSHYR